jgi:hypothetical protein
MVFGEPGGQRFGQHQSFAAQTAAMLKVKAALGLAAGSRIAGVRADLGDLVSRFNAVN